MTLPYLIAIAGHIAAGFALAGYWLAGWPGVIISLFLDMSLVLVAATFALGWAAKGEPDVNGDPERDAGMVWPPDDDLQPAACVWDHGSARTAGATVLPPAANPNGHASHLSPTTSND